MARVVYDAVLCTSPDALHFYTRTANVHLRASGGLSKGILTPGIVNKRWLPELTWQSHTGRRYQAHGDLHNPHNACILLNPPGTGRTSANALCDLVLVLRVRHPTCTLPSVPFCPRSFYIGSLRVSARDYDVGRTNEDVETVSLYQRIYDSEHGRGILEWAQRAWRVLRHVLPNLVAHRIVAQVVADTDVSAWDQIPGWCARNALLSVPGEWTLRFPLTFTRAGTLGSRICPYLGSVRVHIDWNQSQYSWVHRAHVEYDAAPLDPEEILPAEELRALASHGQLDSLPQWWRSVLDHFGLAVIRTLDPVPHLVCGTWSLSADGIWHRSVDISRTSSSDAVSGLLFRTRWAFDRVIVRVNREPLCTSTRERAAREAEALHLGQRRNESGRWYALPLVDPDEGGDWWGRPERVAVHGSWSVVRVDCVELVFFSGSRRETEADKGDTARDNLGLEVVYLGYNIARQDIHGITPRMLL